MKSFQITAFAILTYSLFFTNCKKEDSFLPNETYMETANASDITTTDRNSTYYMPDETQPHEGTWLQWPHQYQYGSWYRNSLSPTWVAMTKELVESENVHIIAYNNSHKNWIINKLNQAGVPLTNVDFYIFQTNDVWVRDNGPIFVEDANGNLKIEDWGFNGWGNKAPYLKDNPIPASIANSIGMPMVNLNGTMKVEGGAFEVDGNGVFLATKSAILNNNRNPGMTQAQAEAIFTENLGVGKFIWLDGVPGVELTDMHIDGFARFGTPNTIVTMNNSDLQYWEVPQSDIDVLYAATDIDGTPYHFVYLPLTQNNVKTAYGKNLWYKGSYVNFYTANTKVLVPIYNDPNDTVAIAILQGLYPDKEVVGIDVRNLYENGGMVHCVTQQQPE
ncbi:MAG TPA: agmatine deiminase family protein [Saprospiraceae bacterium]|nr:agmatine deiminase family protein [Saprospiraceae bacterium]HMQ81304.1 agmatine deiminase family protein [Saprospiraceae bacterium]